MPNKITESLVREICVDSSELVALVKSHAQEPNELRFCIQVASRPVRDVMC